MDEPTSAADTEILRHRVRVEGPGTLSSFRTTKRSAGNLGSRRLLEGWRKLREGDAFANEDKLVGMMVGRELTALHPAQPARVSGPKSAIWDMMIKGVSFRLHREIVGLAGLLALAGPSGTFDHGRGTKFPARFCSTAREVGSTTHQAVGHWLCRKT